MLKQSTLGAAVLVSLLLTQSTAHAQYGLTAYDYLDNGYCYSYYACESGDWSADAYDAYYYAYCALYYANYAYAYDEPDYYYWAYYYSDWASEYALEDYWATGNYDSLEAYYNLCDGAGYAWDAYCYGG